MKKYLLTALAVLLMVSCGNSRSEETSSAEIRSYSVDGVEYTIPLKPERIVADYYVGELLKLEANLVGADLTYTSSAWEDKLDGVTDIGQSLESVMALQPDLIITMNQGMMEQYKSIAPTVLIPYGLWNPEELIEELSVLTGTEETAEAWLSDFNSRVDELSRLIPDPGEEYTIIDVWGGNAYLYGEHYGRSGYILYNKLGLKGTPDGERDYIRKPDSYLNLSIEALPRYAGDVLLLMSTDNDASETSFFTETVVWENLPAVQNNRVLTVDSRDFQFSDPFSLDLQLEILTRLFREGE
ncbi:MAG: ABC transporter substrate-binding protein [Spirochaetales bacterium]|nr:ABC transporter substrate-binding protein [Spirochaetales bacterium]